MSSSAATPCAPTACAAFIGINRSDSRLDVCVQVNQPSAEIEVLALDNSPEAIQRQVHPRP